MEAAAAAAEEVVGAEATLEACHHRHILRHRRLRPAPCEKERREADQIDHNSSNSHRNPEAEGDIPCHPSCQRTCRRLADRTAKGIEMRQIEARAVAANAAVHPTAKATRRGEVARLAVSAMAVIRWKEKAMATRGVIHLALGSGLLSTFDPSATRHTKQTTCRHDGATEPPRAAWLHHAFNNIGFDATWLRNKRRLLKPTSCLSIVLASRFWLPLFSTHRKLRQFYSCPSSLSLVRFNRHTRNQRLTYIAIDKKRGGPPPTNHGVGLPQVAMPLSLEINLTASPNTNI